MACPQSFTSLRGCAKSNGFTLVELLVVITVVIVLGFLIMPGMAQGKADAWSAMCRNQMRQLGLGFRLFQQDNNEMFPPAGVGAGGGQCSWDSFIHRYIGGAPGIDMSIGAHYKEEMPKILQCPADLQPKQDWIGNPPWLAIRSYAMVGVGPAWGTQYQVNVSERTYPLPNIALGVGIYWSDRTSFAPDWDAKGYKASVVQDPARTILLVEEPNKQGAAGNEWPCISVGVTAPAGSSDFYQIDPAARRQNPGSSANQGVFTYEIHGNRFNYLFHDGHVETLATDKTLGTGTPSAPKGMWTVVAGD